MLAAEITAPAAPVGAPPLLIAHGLFGAGRNWRGIARRLGRARRVVAVDMRNHGRSVHAPDMSYEAMAGDLAEVIAAEGGQADVMGHSMGGKAAMMLALTHPAGVRRLIVLDIAPVAYGHDHQNLIAAMRAVPAGAMGRRADADRALSAHVDEPAVRAFLLQSLDTAEGRWRFNLDALEAGMPSLTGWPEVGGRFEGPALFLSGAESDYLRPGHRDAVKALFPAARFARLPGAGHWLHADRPEEVSETVEAYLAAPDA